MPAAYFSKSKEGKMDSLSVYIAVSVIFIGMRATGQECAVKHGTELKQLYRSLNMVA